MGFCNLFTVNLGCRGTHGGKRRTVRLETLEDRMLLAVGAGDPLDHPCETGAFEYAADAVAPTAESEVKMEVAIVLSDTLPAGSFADTLPESVESVDYGSIVYAQVWVRNVDGSSLGTIGGYVNIVYSDTTVSVDSCVSSELFSVFANYADSSAAGVLATVGGVEKLSEDCFSLGTLGVDSWVLLATGVFSTVASGTAEFSVTPPTYDGKVAEWQNLARFGEGLLFSSEILFGNALVEVSEGSVVPLDAPVVSDVSSYGQNRHMVAWTEVSNVLGYEIAYSSDQSTWSSVSVDAGSVSTVITGLTYGNLEYYKVRALGDGVSYANSDWSAAKSLRVCPMSIIGGRIIGSADFTALSSNWMKRKSNPAFDPRCDINGSGMVDSTDFLFLSQNWMKQTTSTSLVYPSYPASASEAAFSGTAYDLFEPGDALDSNLGVF